MMKKILISISVLLSLLLVVCFAACSNSAADQLREINVMLKADYSVVTVDVMTEYDNAPVNGKYVFTKQGDETTVEYAYDQINKFEVNNGVITAPEQFKSRVEGVAVVKDNAIISVDGDPITAEELKQLSPASFMFRLSCFTDIKSSNTSFSAKVINPKAFLGDESFVGTDMTVSVKYADKTLTSLQVVYTSQEGASVTIVYNFTK